MGNYVHTHSRCPHTEYSPLCQKSILVVLGSTTSSTTTTRTTSIPLFHGPKGTLSHYSCKKCSSSGHSSSNCPRYPFFYEQKCSKCAANGRVLYHPPDLCRFFPPTRYLTPEPAKSPVSYKRNENVSSIFQKN